MNIEVVESRWHTLARKVFPYVERLTECRTRLRDLQVARDEIRLNREIAQFRKVCVTVGEELACGPQ